MSKPDYDTTIARIAGNIASGMKLNVTIESSEIGREHLDIIAELTVKLARAIVAEAKRTQPLPIAENTNVNGTLPRAGHTP